MGWLICAVQRRCALCWTFAIAQEMPFNLSTYPETEQEYEMRRKHMSWRNGYSWEILLVFPIFSSISFICISQTESRCKYHFSFCTIIYKHRHKPTLTVQSMYWSEAIVHFRGRARLAPAQFICWAVLHKLANQTMHWSAPMSHIIIVYIPFPRGELLFLTVGGVDRWSLINYRINCICIKSHSHW